MYRLFLIIACSISGLAMAGDFFMPVDEAAMPAKTKNFGDKSEIRQRVVAFDTNHFLEVLNTRVDGEALYLELFDDITLETTTQTLTPDEDGIFTWGGNIEWADHGEARLYFKDDRVLGYVRVDGRLFGIEPDGKGMTLITELAPTGCGADMRSTVNNQRHTGMMRAKNGTIEDASLASEMVYHPGFAGAVTSLDQFVSPVDAMIDPGNNLNIANISNHLANTNKKGIKLLVLYDVTECRMEDLLRTALRDQLEWVFNHTVSNGVFNEIKFDLVLECYPNINYGNTMNDTLNNLIDDPFINQLREAQLFDLVSLVSDHWTPAETGYYGISDTPGDYSFVLLKNIMALFALPHEVAHNFGALHDRVTENQPNGPSCSYGFTNDNGPYTIMSSKPAGCDDCTKVSYFSQPGDVDGFPIGTTCSADLPSTNRLIIDLNTDDVDEFIADYPVPALTSGASKYHTTDNIHSGDTFDVTGADGRDTTYLLPAAAAGTYTFSVQGNFNNKLQVMDTDGNVLGFFNDGTNRSEVTLNKTSNTLSWWLIIVDGAQGATGNYMIRFHFE